MKACTKRGRRKAYNPRDSNATRTYKAACIEEWAAYKRGMTTMRQMQHLQRVDLQIQHIAQANELRRKLDEALAAHKAVYKGVSDGVLPEV